MTVKVVYRCLCDECKRKNSETVEFHRSVNRVVSELDERSRRLFAGMLARQFGRGGIARVAEITGMSRMTIRRGLRECEAGQAIDTGRIRQPGGGRIAVEKKIRVLLERSKNC